MKKITPLTGFPECFFNIIEKAKSAEGTNSTKNYALEHIEVDAIADSNLEKTLACACNGHIVPSICVSPQSITVAFNTIKEAESVTRVSTSINYPTGRRALVEKDGVRYHAAPVDTKNDIRIAARSGARVINVVFDHQSFLENNSRCFDLLRQADISHRPDPFALKMTLETPAFKSYGTLVHACERLIHDYLKDGDSLRTATGTYKEDKKGNIQGTSLEEAAVLIHAIVKSGKNIGIEISHGPETNNECAQFIELARQIAGEEFLASGRLSFSDPELMENLRRVSFVPAKEEIRITDYAL